MSFRVRRATLSDVDACARVCLLTGCYGADGTLDFPNDPAALSRLYTTPYLLLEPLLSLVLIDDAADGAVVGYCLATSDTAAFYARFEAEFRPTLLSHVPTGAAAARASSREASIYALYAQPDYSLPPGLLERHAAHVHIDLLPHARGLGFGRTLMRLQLAQLARRGCTGVHLNMAASNVGAAAFYATLGFSEFSRAGSGDDTTVFLTAPLARLPAIGPNPYPGEQTNVTRYVEGAGAALAIGDACLGASWVAVTMPDPWRVARDRLGGELPLSVVMVDSVDEHKLEAALAALPPETQVVAGIGGGMAVDAAKYFSWRRGLRLVTIPTALTVDAFVTPPAGIRKGASHVVEYVGAATPDPLVVDFDLIRTAPAWLNVAGVGDILSCHTACADWERAHAAGRSDDCPFSATDVAAARRVLADTLAAVRDIAAATDEGLRALVHGYMRINALCLPAGHPRAEEGSEHFILYILEARLKRGFIHGHIVGLGIYLMARLQGNDAIGITAAMRELGLRFDPEAMGLTRADVHSALLGLREFKDGRPDLFYTVIDEAVIDAAWVDAALEGLQFASAE